MSNFYEDNGLIESRDQSCITSSGVNLAEEGRYLIEKAARKGIPLRLTGGVAIWMRASNEARVVLSRHYPDLDLVAHSKHSPILQKMLTDRGYKPECRFNALHGDRRLLYSAADSTYDLDVFLDQLHMSHKLDLGRRLEVEEFTIPAAELILTKLQIAEINYKDLNDVAMLLFDHELTDEDKAYKLNMRCLAELCSTDWGLFTTVNDNLEKMRDILPELLLDDSRESLILSRIKEFQRRLVVEPKTYRWKLRAKVGRRICWYERPDDVDHAWKLHSQ